MSAQVTAFVPSRDSAAFIVNLVGAVRQDRRVHFLAYDPDGSGEIVSAIRKELCDGEQEASEITPIASSTPVSAVTQVCRSEKAELLVTSVFTIDSLGSRAQTSRELIRSAPCRTVTVMNGGRVVEGSASILVLANGGPHDLATLRTALSIGESVGAEVSIAILEPDSGAKAERAGEKAIGMLLHDASLDESDFQTTVVVDDDRDREFRQCVAGYDFVISGTDGFDDLWQSGFDSGQTTVLVVKRNPPLRLRSLPEWIPRINPHDHADLLQDLRHGSRWRTDFVAMLGLASAIASLGMLQHSPAVVIGSMLLAPLMTPMIGLGLAITQANALMARTCWKSIQRGFLLTLSVSFALGIITPVRETLSPEILARGTPNILDLLVAIFAAVAATTAMARPNISGAIAGVAIATALVPPICSVGLSLSRGFFENSLGAMLLFLTNLVAIIVTSSFTFSVLGVSASRSTTRFATQSRWLRWGLVGTLVLLAGPLSLALINQLDQGRPQVAVYPVTRAVSRAVSDRVNQDAGVEVSFMGRSSVMDAVVIHLAADHEISPSYGDELREIVREQMGDPKTAVYVVCLSGQWLNRDPDDSE